jgi:membrane protease YdiL (CAAX protease family)
MKTRQVVSLPSDSQIAIASLLLAAVLWVFIFVVPPFEFWIVLASSTLALLILAVSVSRGKLGVGPTAVLVLYGVLSAILMYAVFYYGFQATKSSPIFSQGINHVYALRWDEPPWLVALLLVFPIGPGEELYWRGLIQRTFSERKGRYLGVGLASIAYSLVHIPTFNLPLILAALICGLVWGSMYAITNSLTPGIVSHVLWDVMIFVLLPLH